MCGVILYYVVSDGVYSVRDLNFFLNLFGDGEGELH